VGLIYQAPEEGVPLQTGQEVQDKIGTIRRSRHNPPGKVSWNKGLGENPPDFARENQFAAGFIPGAVRSFVIDLTVCVARSFTVGFIGNFDRNIAVCAVLPGGRACAGNCRD
jgi:hypothetical protein